MHCDLLQFMTACVKKIYSIVISITDATTTTTLSNPCANSVPESLLQAKSLKINN